VECLLLQFIKDGDLDTVNNRQSLIDGYSEVFKRGSVRERSSTCDNIQFLEEMLGFDKRASLLVNALKTIRESLVQQFGNDDSEDESRKLD
jgi:hypothetical protein